MRNIVKKIFKNRRTRGLLLLFIVLIGIALTNSYFVQIELLKEKVFGKLEAVVKISSSRIDGDKFEKLLEEYKEKDQITSNFQNKTYEEVHELLNSIKITNNLNNEIYTLTPNEEGNFFFGASSADTPFYRHIYDHFPPELKENYQIGGKIGVYNDANGNWLSAFSPIKNSKGKVIAIVQADYLFDDFIKETRSSILKSLGFSLILMLILGVFLIQAVQSILTTEEKLTSDLIKSKNILERKNKDIMDSIQYAHNIQKAILSKPSDFVNLFSESFLFFIPRDIVSGDFYWFKKIGHLKIVACVDCTGHGIPGAFMSMIGSILLDEIVMSQDKIEPGKILDNLNHKVIDALKQNQIDTDSRDGMDVALCVLNEEKNEICYAGAGRPLIHIQDNEIKQINGDIFPIGGLMHKRTNFQTKSVPFKKGDCFYLYSDGYPDQFGGERDKKYMTSRFRKFLHSISNQPMSEQKKSLTKELKEWQGESEQIDDILIIGFRI